MRLLPVIVTLTVFIQPAETVTASPRLSPGCVATARMPIATWSAGQRGSDRMPVFAHDAQRPAPMPVAKLVPCYLTDSMPRRFIP